MVVTGKEPAPSVRRSRKNSAILRATSSRQLRRLVPVAKGLGIPGLELVEVKVAGIFADDFLCGYGTGGVVLRRLLCNPAGNRLFGSQFWT